VKRGLPIAIILISWLTITCGSEPTTVPATMPAATATAEGPLESPLPTATSTPDVLESPVGLPNPASQYCEDQGYRLEIREESGGSTAYCLFPDGSECEEWAFFRGECDPGTSP
jgi:putative hemolysin